MKSIDKRLLFENVSNLIERDLEENNIAGAAVMVAQHGEILLDERFGNSDFLTKKPLERNAIFRLASMTKPVTAVAALIGVQKGWFDLNDPVHKHFPEFENLYVGRLENGQAVPDHKPKREVCLWQLLSHNNGFMASSPLYEQQEKKMPKEAFISNKTAVDYCLKNTCLTLEPYYETGYSGYFSFDMIALLLERYSGMTYADFIYENIFKPLGIKDITYTPTNDQWQRMVMMFEKTVGNGGINVDMGRHTFEGFPLSYTCAGAGLAGSIEDYFVFAEMLRNGGTYKDTEIVKPDIFAKIHKKYVPMEYMPQGAIHTWGLGVRIAVGDPVLPDGCWGWSGAYGTHFWIDPENDITAIYMKNNRWHDSRGCGQTGKEFEKQVMASLKS